MLIKFVSSQLISTSLAKSSESQYRVHVRVTRNNTPGIIPTPIINTEGGKEFFPPIAYSEGVQKSVRKQTPKTKGKRGRKIEKSRKN